MSPQVMYTVFFPGPGEAPTPALIVELVLGSGCPGMAAADTWPTAGAPVAHLGHTQALAPQLVPLRDNRVGGSIGSPPIIQEGRKGLQQVWRRRPSSVTCSDTAPPNFSGSDSRPRSTVSDSGGQPLIHGGRVRAVRDNAPSPTGTLNRKPPGYDPTPQPDSGSPTEQVGTTQARWGPEGGCTGWYVTQPVAELRRKAPTRRPS
ncbi:hypothetical protein NDU88_006068 [Pleurodeles waltl]|uniref:Uncharacterized protein n=1 Tax=Pleurodeles waltl TaxID=8319 RepID=A0AAV7TD76_PLEWA|nr:hypothetical protein NDU88_006068 [Pleurodeles waltl]